LSEKKIHIDIYIRQEAFGIETNLKIPTTTTPPNAGTCDPFYLVGKLK
jgi:hypothetical protein